MVHKIAPFCIVNFYHFLINTSARTDVPRNSACTPTSFVHPHALAHLNYLKLALKGNFFFFIGAAFHDQDFPSLPGAPKGGSSQPKPQPQFRPPPKPVPKPVAKRQPDFPSLSSEPRSRGSDNILSNFRAVDSQPQFRNLPGKFFIFRSFWKPE